MIDREPVDIMGVTAFPNPNKDERVIRFIDSEYPTMRSRPRRAPRWFQTFCFCKSGNEWWI